MTWQDLVPQNLLDCFGACSAVEIIRRFSQAVIRSCHNLLLLGQAIPLGLGAWENHSIPAKGLREQ